MVRCASAGELRVWTREIVMLKRISIGLIGDYDKSVPAHQAIPLALQRAAEALHVELGFEWVSSFMRVTSL